VLGQGANLGVVDQAQPDAALHVEAGRPQVRHQSFVQGRRIGRRDDWPLTADRAQRLHLQLEARDAGDAGYFGQSRAQPAFTAVALHRHQWAAADDDQLDSFGGDVPRRRLDTGQARLEVVVAQLAHRASGVDEHHAPGRDPIELVHKNVAARWRQVGEAPAPAVHSFAMVPR
jgi:hypothetical protein